MRSGWSRQRALSGRLIGTGAGAGIAVAPILVPALLDAAGGAVLGAVTTLTVARARPGQRYDQLS